MSLRYVTLTLLLTIGLVVNSNAVADLKQAHEKFHAKDFQAANKIYRSLLDKTPNSSELSYFLARSYTKQGLQGKANQVLEDSLEVYPDNVKNLYQLGMVKMDLINEVSIFKKLGTAKKGLKTWRRAVELAPDHVEARYGICTYLVVAPGFAGGDLEAAKLEIEALRKISPAWADLAHATLLEKEENFVEAGKLFASAAENIEIRAFPKFMLIDFYVKQNQLDNADIALASYQRQARSWNDPGELGIEIMTGRIAAGRGDAVEAARHFDKALVLANKESTKVYITKLRQALKDV